MAFPDDVKVHTRSRPGLPGDGATVAEVAAWRAELATYQAALEAGHSLGIHNDVDFAGVADGQVPLWDSAANDGAGGWVAGDASGAISAVQNNAVDLMTDVHTLNAEEGLEFYDQGFSPGEVAIRVKYGGTGTSTSVARADHSHTVPTSVSVPYAAKGSHGSGSLTLATANVTLAAGVSYRVKARVHTTQRANGSESGYYRIYLDIHDGTTLQSDTSQTYQCVGFVPAPQTFEFAITVTGTGASHQVRAILQYISGVPSLVDAGQLVVDLDPAR